ncbi:MAG: glycosyltransferase [Desulfonauticus sp.]|nr:glycosyltransferase [Desulfonauticus sp.]
MNSKHSKPVLFRVTNNLDLGGVQRRLYALLPELTPFYHVHIVTYKKKGILFEELQKKGVFCHYLPLRGKWDPIGIIKMARLFKKYQADIVHTHSFGGNISGILAAFIAGVPVRIGQVHLAKLHWYARGLHRKKQIFEENIIHLLLSKKILFVSKESLNYFLQHTIGLKSKCLILHNGINLTQNIKTKKTELTNLKQIKIGFVGRIARGKGLDYFLNFALEVLKQDKNYLFVVIGGGDITFWKSKIPAWAKENILFLGQKKDVFSYYLDLDLLLFTSEPEVEGMPGVVLEACGCGLPILARESEPVKEIKEYYSRIMFIDEKKTALENLSKALAMPRVSTDKLLEHFSLKAMRDRTLTLYQSLLCK